MTKSENTALAMFELLPQRALKRLKLTDLSTITGAILIKDRISTYFKNAAREETEVRRYKRTQGYCGGYVACLAFVGMNQSMCTECARVAREHAKRQRNGTSRTTRQSEYGRMRAEERRIEREEKNRVAGK
jgi:hypothetical protein